MNDGKDSNRLQLIEAILNKHGIGDLSAPVTVRVTTLIKQHNELRRKHEDLQQRTLERILKDDEQRQASEILDR